MNIGHDKAVDAMGVAFAHSHNKGNRVTTSEQCLSQGSIMPNYWTDSALFGEK